VSPVGRTEALELLVVKGAELYELLARAGKARLRSRGTALNACAIVNAKSGHCSQDCAFCSQSSRSEAAIERYSLIAPERIVDAARQAAEAGACRLGIVTSGRAVRGDSDLEVLAEAVRRIDRELPIDPCASLGIVGTEELERLRDAGLCRYHHNLETAESFWPSICSTRPWQESVRTVEEARALGLPVCSGGIFGLGETLGQRVELLEAIAGLDVDSVPLNFFHPIPGTPLEALAELSPLDCVRIVAVARLMMPEREIRVCGGREHNLRDLQSWILLAGADGVMVGGYLTTRGRQIADDVRMFLDAGFELARPASRQER